MNERKCCRCHEAIESGEDFFSQDGEDSDEVYCIGCIDDAVEHSGSCWISRKRLKCWALVCSSMCRKKRRTRRSLGRLTCSEVWWNER